MAGASLIGACAGRLHATVLCLFHTVATGGARRHGRSPCPPSQSYSRTNSRSTVLLPLPLGPARLAGGRKGLRIVAFTCSTVPGSAMPAGWAAAVWMPQPGPSAAPAPLFPSPILKHGGATAGAARCQTAHRRRAGSASPTIATLSPGSATRETPLSTCRPSWPPYPNRTSCSSRRRPRDAAATPLPAEPVALLVPAVPLLRRRSSSAAATAAAPSVRWAASAPSRSAAGDSEASACTCASARGAAGSCRLPSGSLLGVRSSANRSSMSTSDWRSSR